MYRVCLTVACAVLLAACATPPETATAESDDCRSLEAPIGSHLMHRSDCARPGGAVQR
jgi:starvation-inducible outer membrane lipoprotein